MGCGIITAILDCTSTCPIRELLSLKLLEAKEFKTLKTKLPMLF
jgi:hypothetical protein